MTPISSSPSSTNDNDKETLRYKKQYKTVLDGKRMAYIDVGTGGDPIVFLHGNPTSIYLWRNVIPYLEGKGRRLIAIDMIGMGDSDKLDGGYSLAIWTKYTSALLAELVGIDEKVTLILHDWGSGVGFHWANMNQEKVKAIAFMEAIVMPFPTWDDFNPELHGPIGTLRSSKGEKMVLEDNFFIETLLPETIMRPLTAKEHAEYRRPFVKAGEDRRATLEGPRQLPIAGNPPDTVAIVESYAKYLAKSNDLPKLFVNAEPGAFLVGKARDFVRTWPNLQEVTVKGTHFIQEDSPDDIGKALAEFCCCKLG